MIQFYQQRGKEYGRAWTFYIRLGRFVVEVDLSHDRKIPDAKGAKT